MCIRDSDKAIEIGMGKRTNTILQSAFFKLADVMPIADAINFMKQAAQKSYGKKLMASSIGMTSASLKNADCRMVLVRLPMPISIRCV